MLILKAALECLFKIRLHDNSGCSGQPGEDTLLSILKYTDFEISPQNHITILRRLAKKSSVSIVLSAHRIAFVRARDVKLTYVIGKFLILSYVFYVKSKRLRP